MPICAVVFDIGGVLEIAPPTGWIAKWEAALGFQPGAIGTQLADLWAAGAIGQISEADVERSIQSRLGLGQAQLAAFLGDLWSEYLGTLNAELTDYFRSLRPRYQTAIISNSFVGAREKEQQHYQFDTLCDFIVYSHEVGIEKPDRRIFDLTCDRLGLQPNEIIFLDDTKVHVAAARELGMAAILFSNTAQAIAEIEAQLRSAA